MDPLSDRLDRARARGSVFALSDLSAPWGLVSTDHTPLSIHVALAGELWVVPGDDDVEPVRLLPGDIALVHSPHPYRLADDPATPGRPLDQTEEWALPGTNGRFANPPTSDDGARTRLLCGAYLFDGDLCDSLLRVLAPVVVVRGDLVDRAGGIRPVLDLIIAEIRRDDPGRPTVLDRLLDVLLVNVLRAHLPDALEAPPWFRADSDPEVAAAVRRLHGDPAHRWTVAELASSVGLSRAALARRFTQVVGIAPLTYLTDWRMQLASQELLRTDRPVTTIAHEVGYANEFAFATAFRRWAGRSPTQFRKREADPRLEPSEVTDTSA